MGEIKVGDTVERIKHGQSGICKGDRVVVESVRCGGMLEIAGHVNTSHTSGLYAIEAFKKVKGATTTKLSQLEKDYEAMGETIKAMKEAEKSVWCVEHEIQSGRSCYNARGREWKFAVLEEGGLKYNLVDVKSCCIKFLSAVTRKDIIEYLNENNYTKA